MHSNDLEACGMKLCSFWFHSDVKFLTRSLYSGERQWPTWASCLVRLLIEVTLYYQSYYSTKILHKKSSLSNPDPVQTEQIILSH